MNRKGPDLSKNSVITGSAARKGQGGFSPTVFENYKELLRKSALNPPPPFPPPPPPLPL